MDVVDAKLRGEKVCNRHNIVLRKNEQGEYFCKKCEFDRNEIIVKLLRAKRKRGRKPLILR